MNVASKIHNFPKPGRQALNNSLVACIVTCQALIFYISKYQSYSSQLPFC